MHMTKDNAGGSFLEKIKQIRPDTCKDVKKKIILATHYIYQRVYYSKITTYV